MTPPRVRFAPSPTGYLHVGGARTALFNWLYARRLGGAFVLRIEDTDKARSTDEHTQVILDGLSWLGVTWDEGPFFQGAYADRHRADAERLLAAGRAYKDFLTAEELDAERAKAKALGAPFRFERARHELPQAEQARREAAGLPYAIRFAMRDEEIAWDDAVHGRISWQGRDLDDFIVLRSDGSAIYNMAVVSDDIAMRITLVMRGDDHISNTPKQIMLYAALGASLPQFAHLPMIHGLDGKKLSKRHGATAVGDYRHQGILPQAMLNFLALLGWSPGNDIEVMTVPQMVELFSVEGLSKKAAIFDPKKLEWMNGQHLSLLASEALAPIVSDALVEARLTTREEINARRSWLISLIDLLKVRSRTIDDIVRQAAPYLAEHVSYDPDAVAKHWKDRAATVELLSNVRNTLTSLNTWEPHKIEDGLRAQAEHRGIGAGKMFQPLRVALTGLTVSAGIFDVLMLLGRERSLERIDDAVNFLSA